MKFTIEKSRLAPAMAALMAVVERRTTIQILSHVRVEAGDGGLAISASDLDIWLTASLPADVIEPGALALPAARLEEIARNMPDGGQVSAAIEEGGSRISLKAGRARYALNTLPAADWPEGALGQGEEPVAEIALPARLMLRLAGEPGHAISNEPTRYYLMGLHLRARDGGGGLDAVATNGHKLHLIETSLEAPGANSIIPAKTVAVMGRLAKAAPEAEARLAIWPTRLAIEIGGWRLASKLIDGSFPDYRRVIPNGLPHLVRFDAAGLKAAIERVMAVNDEKSKAVKLEISGGGESLSANVSSRNGSGEEAREEISAEIAGGASGRADIAIGFNGAYAREILAALDGDTVTIAYADPGSPMLWRRGGGGPEGGSALCVLMPMRA
jgi:DNA polymerase-3 subunit beta